MSCLGCKFGSITPCNLRTEQMENPLGVSMQNPRFSWQINCKRADNRQASYHVAVATAQDKLSAPDMWDSGEVQSNQVSLIEYKGAKLAAFTRYWWQVTVSDADGASATSEPAMFTMGITQDTPWCAPFLAMPNMDYRFNKAEYFRRTFNVSKPLEYALALVCGLGYNEVSINGKKQGDAMMEPGWTTFNKRAQYVTHDITADLQPGANAIGVVLGEGWYNNRSEAFQHFGFGQPLAWLSNPRMSCEIVLCYKDGTTEIIADEKGWQVGAGPIKYNDVFNGETYDARDEKPGWDTAEGEKYNWVAPYIVAAPTANLEPEMSEPIKTVDEIKPVSLTEPKPNVFVYDMGRNFAGIVRIKVKAPAGTRILLRFAEMLYADGTINQENLRWAKNTDEYICKGEGEEIWQPRFTYHGFRFVSLEGIKPEIDTVLGLTVRSAVEKTGVFSCGNELLNKIQQCVVHTEESNMHSVPTDCPQRDERQGWVNDCTVRIEEIVYNFGVGAFLRKWQKDMADTQGEDGAIADVAPRVYGCEKADPLSSIFLFAPWFNYMFYGDKRILEEQYDNLCRWEGYITSRSHFGIVDYSYYGDWAGPVDGCPGGREANSAVSAITPGQFVSTIFYYQNAVMLAKMAHIIGREQDVQPYKDLAEYIKASINSHYFNYQTAQYALGSQATNTLALHFDIVPDGYREKVLANLLDDIKAHNYHLTTGNIATKYLFEVLSDNGCVDYAYALATQEDYPSWGYMLANGATTIWERWELGTTSAMNSHNHPMYGTISTWFYKHLAGISPLEPGFDKVRIAPKLPQKLSDASARLDTVRGTVQSGWKKTENGVHMDVILPFGTEAVIEIPAGYKLQTVTGNVTNDNGRLLACGGSIAVELIKA